MNSTFNSIKNIIWAIAIAVCLFALIIGLLIASFNRFRGVREDFALDLGSAKVQSVSSDAAVSDMAGLGELNKLGTTSDAGDEYISRITFLCDSAFINLRELGLVGTNQVWGSTGGSLSMVDLNMELIKFPNDGSDVSVVNASMVSKPDILLMMLGMDGLTRIDEDTFISNYVTLINDVRANSPDTKIICCSPASISETYSGDDYSVGLVSSATQWIQIVCMKTGAYYLDLGEAVGESFQMLAKYSASNGRSVNRLGLQTCLDYIRTHALLK